MRYQIALQAMVDIARVHDRQLQLVPSLENLAAYRQVPAELLQRMLDALQRDGLIQLSAQNPPLYLPGASLRQIKLADILRSARAAEDDGQSDSFRSDAPVSAVLREMELEFESHLGQLPLVEFLKKFSDDGEHEDSLV
jgi:DNA-binding IscR family transcriptional regulator